MSEPTVQPDQGEHSVRTAAAGVPALGDRVAGQPSPLVELLKIAAPTVATMTSYTLMQFVDKFLVSRIGPDPVYVGAQGNGGLAAFVPIALAMGALTVINSYVSQNMGAGKPERGPAYAWNGMWMAAAYWLVLLVPYGLALPWIFGQAGLDGEQGRLAAVYGEILVYGAVLTMWTRALSQFFYGMHKAGIILIAGLAANVFNLVLSSFLIFGKDAWPVEMGAVGEAGRSIAAAVGLPALGVAGSAYGTVISTGLELAIPLVLFLGPGFNRKFQTRSQWRLSWPHVRDLFRIGWPAGLMFGNEMICWGYFMVYLVSHFGKVHATAGWIAHQYMSLSFMPAVGISVACTAVVGKYMGMGRPDLAARRAWLGLRLAAVYMALCGVLFVVFRRPMIGLFVAEGTDPAVEAELIRLGSMFLIATATFQAFDGIAMTLGGALRGAGDTVAPGIVTVVLSWLVIVGGGTMAVEFLPGLSSLGPWIAAAVYIVLLSQYLLFRFIGGRWRSMKLVKGDPVIKTGGVEASAAVGSTV